MQTQQNNDSRCYDTLAAVSSPSALVEAAATEAKYEMTFFVFSVLPAPDSPLYQQRTMRFITMQRYDVMMERNVKTL